MLIITCYFLLKPHSDKQTLITRVFPSGTHFIAVSTDALRIKYIAQGYNILIQSGFEQSTYVSSNRYLTHMTNMLTIEVGTRLINHISSAALTIFA